MPKREKPSVDTSTLQQEGGAKVELRPRNPGEALKVAKTVLRRREQNLEEKAERAKKIRGLKRREDRDCHQQVIKSAQYFVKRARLRSVDNKRVVFAKKTPAKKPREQERRPLILAVRNGREGGSPEVQAGLKRLGLRKPFWGTVLRNDEATLQQLRLLDPFVFYGYPTYATLRKLFLTRGCLRINEKESTPLTDNAKVEEHLGAYGMLCVEDVVQELWKGGGHFDDIKQHLCAFQLSNLKKVEGLYARRNEFGNMREAINTKIWKIA
ncbi:putative ribosomal protein L7 [Neospora caninum Liverpool]|uniref:Putative ribosomal protein L7 n=1 Tax=Neospora caninum (strain Liverpool) TaxID=572307 RepID=F0VR54_NEOCL|nr:putative ribosomal protein L7 [Neospora caninum Liverpool]CBZ56202.1 putative ribosomal protein L7 [Neospora caninum Liverpool]CEL70964.1 TPA: ribosomal protein L7, putative [Neospora caninum Liverpool]|eukprot:XP_003886227.1 putative ribosomal protein L7 [Neospora caninum Liverpool]